MRFFYILLFISIGVYAQNPKYDLDYYFSEFETPNSSIPTPKEVIGTPLSKQMKVCYDRKGDDISNLKPIKVEELVK